MKKLFMAVVMVFVLMFAGVSFGKSLDVTWEYPYDNDVVEFILYYSTTSGTDYQELTVILYDGTETELQSEVEMDVPAGTDQDYYFVMTARDDAGNESEYSTEATCNIDTKAPEPVEVLNVTININVVE